MSARTCAECAYLRKDAPTQMFLRCQYWLTHGNGKWADVRIYRQPYAPTCYKFKDKHEKTDYVLRPV